MEKKELKEQLNGFLGDYSDLDMLTDYVLELLDKAREEGRRESKQEISGYFSKTEGEHILERGKEYVVISRELYDKLSKLNK